MHWKFGGVPNVAFVWCPNYNYRPFDLMVDAAHAFAHDPYFNPV